MFGFGDRRKKYNGEVDVKLNTDYQIATRDNPWFPGVLAYLEMIDPLYHSKRSADECALYIAVTYYCGLLTHGHHSIASDLLTRIQSMGQTGASRGAIDPQFWTDIKKGIERAKQATGVQ